MKKIHYIRPAIKMVAAENGKLLEGSTTQALPSGNGQPGTFGAKPVETPDEVWFGM